MTPRVHPSWDLARLNAEIERVEREEAPDCDAMMGLLGYVDLLIERKFYEEDLDGE